eukprot:COSAG01_NODE_65326_length_273_cov_1.482759_1_plen_71_part_01
MAMVDNSVRRPSNQKHYRSEIRPSKEDTEIAGLQVAKCRLAAPRLAPNCEHYGERRLGIASTAPVQLAVLC